MNDATNNAHHFAGNTGFYNGPRGAWVCGCCRAVNTHKGRCGCGESRINHPRPGDSAPAADINAIELVW